MATITAPPPVEEIDVTTPEVEVKVKSKKAKAKKAKAKTKVVEVKKTKKAKAKKAKSALKRANRKAKAAARKSWKAFLRGLSRMRRRMIRLYRWAKNKARRSWMRTKKYAKLAGTKVKRGAKYVGSKVKGAVKYSGAWMKDAAVGAWKFTAPARAWIATPFRAAMTTTGGLAAMLILGGKFIFGLTVIWLAYLLVTGRMVMKNRKPKRKVIKVVKIKEIKAKKTPAKKRERKVINVQLDPNTRPMNGAQLEAVKARKKDLEIRRSAADVKENKNLRSEYAGRNYVATARHEGSIMTVNALAKNQRTAAENQLGVEAARELYTWSAVKRGMAEEHIVIEKIMETNADSETLVTV